ncbi:MAG TPA: hypothetical protein VLX09_18500 [Stellaceae bacterium]|nr:hypothetical protein [Stellaceae bacterium]
MPATDESVRRTFTRFVRFGIPIALLAIGGCVNELQTSPDEEWPWPLMPGDRLLRLNSPLTPELVQIATDYINSDATLKEDTQLGIDVLDTPFDIRQDMSGAFADIDDDGEPEVFLRFTVGNLCGNDTCPIAILKKIAGRWQAIFEASSIDDYAVILPFKEHGAPISSC